MRDRYNLTRVTGHERAEAETFFEQLVRARQNPDSLHTASTSVIGRQQMHRAVTSAETSDKILGRMSTLLKIMDKFAPDLTPMALVQGNRGRMRFRV